MAIVSVVIATLRGMSLDDAISAARQKAAEQAELKRQRDERAQRERAELKQLLTEALQRLRPSGNDWFVRVKPGVKWYHLDTYRDSVGKRYHKVSRQRCWTIKNIYPSDRVGASPQSSILLLDGGTLGQFWPQNLTSEHSDPALAAKDRYVSTTGLHPVNRDDVGDGAESFLEELKRHLGEAIVAYETSP